MNTDFDNYKKSEDYATDEAFRHIVKGKALRAGCLMVSGVVVIAAALFAEYVLLIKLSDSLSSFLLGFGSGLFFGGMFLLIKRSLQLKDANKLKQARISESDERNRSIANRALHLATMVLLAGMYLVIILSIFIMPELINVMCLLICLFLMAYVVSYKVLQRKM